MKDKLNNLQEEILLKSVFDTIDDGVTVIDKDFKILFQNESIQKKFGLITGKCCYKAYRGREEPCVNCNIIKVFKDGKRRKTLEDTVMPNGNVLWMECSCGPLLDDNGKIIGAVEIVRDVTDNIRITNEYVQLKREVNRQSEFENIITQSKKIKSIFNLIERVGPTSSSVLITGESGTGKELFAKSIWHHSNINEEPFVAVNCSAIPETLFESELFGHKKGAFTGAVNDHLGIIDTANGGTLFLDEVGDMPLAV